MTDDIPAVLAVADRIALPAGLTDLQRQEALQSIVLFRALSPIFLDSAEKLIQEGTTESAELFSAGTQGARLGTALGKICKALWSLEDDVFSQRSARIAELTVKGKENNTNATN